MIRSLPPFVLLCAIVLGGCAPWATYPKIEGATQVSHPELPPIPQLMALALLEVHAKARLEPTLLFNLPEGSSVHVYEKVKRELRYAQRGGEGEPVPFDVMSTPDQNAYHVVELRLRMTDAEVDVVHRDLGGTPQMTTVVLKQELISGWSVIRSRTWRIPSILPQPTYPKDAVPMPASDAEPPT